MPETNMAKLPLDKIKTDGGTQARAALNEAVVAEYAEAIIAGADMPPVTVFHDGKAHWLADGFHRFFAHKQARAIEIDADVRAGTKRDAKWFSLGANQAHGLRRSNEDKRCAVRDALRDREWAKLSDRELAAHIGVSHSFVAAVRDPDKAARQQANRDASATRRVESDSTPAAQTAPQSHSPAAPAPEPAQTRPAGEHQRPPAEESHNGAASAPPEAEEQAVSAPPVSGTGDASSTAADRELTDLREQLVESRQNAAELADLLEGYTTVTAGEVAAAKEIAKLQAQLRTVGSQRDQYMTTCNELKRTVKVLQRENGRLKKRLEPQGK